MIILVRQRLKAVASPSFVEEKNVPTGEKVTMRRSFIVFIVLAATCGVGVVPAEHRSSSGRSIVLESGIAEYLRDGDASLMFDDVRGVALSSAFRPNRGRAFSFGLVDSVHWIRFRLDAPELNTLTDVQRLSVYFDFATLEYIELFVPIPDGDGREYRRLVGGWGYADERDDSGFVFPTFELPVETARTGYVYARVESSLSKNFRIGVADADRFSVTQFRIVLFLAILAGVMIAMAMYNLVMYGLLRESSYLFYLVYLIAMLVYQSIIVGLPRVLGPTVYSVMTRHTIFWTFLAISAALRFSWAYLDVPRTAPAMRRLYYAVWAACAISIVFVFAGRFALTNRIAYAMGFVLPFVAFVAARQSYRHGSPVSNYFIAAITVLLVSVHVFALRGIGVLPHSFVTTYGFFVAAAAEAVLYSFALADRVRRLRDEHTGLTRRAAELSDIAMTDELTGAYNRRFFNRVLPTTIEIARISGAPLSLMYLDVDQFKSLNDVSGHAVGDDALRELAGVMKKNLRATDVPCRIGGDEFAAVLPSADGKNALASAERIREDVKMHVLRARSSDPVSISVSIGIAELTDGLSAHELTTRADEAMYEAKQLGRNRCVVYGSARREAAERPVTRPPVP